MGGALLTRCLGRGHRDGAALRKSAGAKRARDKKAKAAAIAKQAVWLELWRGHDDEAGEVTLADGLEDVEVTFNKRRRCRWSGTKLRRRKRSSTDEVSAKRRKAKRRPGATSINDESSDSDSGSESSSSEEVSEDIELFELGEMLRIYWTEEKVWFRCAIKGLLEGGRLIQVEYMVKGWGLFIHRVADIQWKRMRLGDAEDSDEDEYEMDRWAGDEDHEAVAAAEDARNRKPRDERERAIGDKETESGESESEGVCELEGTPQRVARIKRTGHAKAGCTDRQASRRELPDKYKWLQGAMGQVKGRRKRCELVWSLIAEWDTDSSVELHELRANRKSIYRRMGGIMKPALINTELIALEKVGWVVIHEDAVWVGRRGAARATEELSEDDDPDNEAAKVVENTGTPEHEESMGKISGSEKRKREGAGKDNASGESSVEARTGKRRKKESSGDAGVLGADRVLRGRSKRKRVTTESSSGGEEDDDEGGHNRAKKPSL